MKAALLLVVLASMVLSCTAHALSTDSEVPPGPQDYLPLKFEIQSERLAGADIQFTVTISENIGSQSRFVNFPPARYGTSLGTIKITYGPDGRLGSESSRSLRSVASELHGNVIKCVFSVTTKELEDPDFVFFFSIPAPNNMLAFDEYFAHLRKYLKPQ